MWKQMTRSASGITKEEMTEDFGVVPTQGAWAFMSKNTAPVSRTHRSTSDKTSIPKLLDQIVH
jgi:hypothetical protein